MLHSDLLKYSVRWLGSESKLTMVSYLLSVFKCCHPLMMVINMLYCIIYYHANLMDLNSTFWILLLQSLEHLCLMFGTAYLTIAMREKYNAHNTTVY